MCTFFPRNVDKVNLVLIPCINSELCAADAMSWRMQGISVVVRRELCRGLQLGLKVTIIGVPTHKLTTQSHRTYVDMTIEVSVFWLLEGCISLRLVS